MHAETYQRLTGEICAAYGDWFGEEHRRRQRLRDRLNSIFPMVEQVSAQKQDSGVSYDL
jgi:hypothetical protein